MFAETLGEKLLCVQIDNVPNPNYDLLSFDHIGWAMLMVWQIFTHDMWVSNLNLNFAKTVWAANVTSRTV